MKHLPPSTATASPARLQLDAAAEARLEAYLDLLLRWNGRINLVAKAPVEVLRQRHVADCLQLAPLLPAEGVLADLGSGAGLPGLVLAMVTGLETHLVEADRRKAAFLVEAVARLALPKVNVHAERIEDVQLPPIDILTARALAPLASLLPHAQRLLAPGGTAIFPKGRTAEQELADAMANWSCRVERFPSQTDPASTIFRLSGMRHVQPQA
ncbi:16S rRNA (guanine(527)-N(7))-methyltransferase RsmG [Falsiroseomonas sp. E2-1-a20]|uniref:16S rRNA (guanine(527)-N(7))-methyltransferase RsmG n=1 Tax=Falsiroseomonas sp. E2-1-a20 TaxID=3239300 RepID=UPI003F3BAD67